MVPVKPDAEGYKRNLFPSPSCHKCQAVQGTGINHAPSLDSEAEEQLLLQRRVWTTELWELCGCRFI